MRNIIKFNESSDLYELNKSLLDKDFISQIIKKIYVWEGFFKENTSL